jgi:cobalt-zinc-cadmium efflux system protein
MCRRLDAFGAGEDAARRDADADEGVVVRPAIERGGLSLLLLSGWLTYEAIRRLIEPPEVTGGLYAFTATATAIAGLVMVLTGFARADAIASLVVVVALMLKAGYGLVRESGRIFLEAAPIGFPPETVGRALAARPHVAEIHDLHIWQITSGMPAASARADLEAVLAEAYKITHTTLQVDHAPVPADGADPGHCDESHGPVHRPTGLGAG